MNLKRLFVPKAGGEVRWDDQVADFASGRRFFENLIVRILIVVAFFLSLASVLLLGSAIFPIPIPLVLRYNVYFGVSLLGDWWQVYTVPFVGFLLLGGHIFLAKHYYDLKERIASYILLLASIFIAGGILISALSVVLINF
jgi:hypothetical protein